MFRVPMLRPHVEGSVHGPSHVNLSSARWECRAVDPSTNPYLAAAMFLGAGLDGIDQGLDPGDPQLVNMYELSDRELEERGISQLPRTLLEAVTALEQDDLGRRVMGEELYRSYVDLKKSEWWSYHNAISQWEIDEYLTKF